MYNRHSGSKRLIYSLFKKGETKMNDMNRMAKKSMDKRKTDAKLLQGQLELIIHTGRKELI